jgi:hypothetical protein
VGTSQVSQGSWWTHCRSPHPLQEPLVYHMEREGNICEHLAGSVPRVPCTGLQ